MEKCSLAHENNLRYCTECGILINERLTPLAGCEDFHEELKANGSVFCHECGEQLLPIHYEGKECPNHFDAPTQVGFARKFHCLTCKKDFVLQRLG